MRSIDELTQDVVAAAREWGNEQCTPGVKMTAAETKLANAVLAYDIALAQVMKREADDDGVPNDKRTHQPRDTSRPDTRSGSTAPAGNGAGAAAEPSCSEGQYQTSDGQATPGESRAGVTTQAEPRTCGECALFGSPPCTPPERTADMPCRGATMELLCFKPKPAPAPAGDCGCGHYPPQHDAQLHGTCIFCWRDKAVSALADRDRLGAENEELRRQVAARDYTLEGMLRAGAEQAKRADENMAAMQRRAARIEKLEQTIRDLLASADCTWEERRLGHDWADACEAARAALAEEVEP